MQGGENFISPPCLFYSIHSIEIVFPAAGPHLPFFFCRVSVSPRNPQAHWTTTIGSACELFIAMRSRQDDGYSDPVALRREHADAFRRGDALVRGGVNRLDAGVLYLKLYRAIGCLRRFRAGSHWSGSAQSQRNAHRRTDSRRTIRGGVEYVCRIIVEGYAAEEIRNRWREDIGLSRIQRKPSLLYEERPLFRSIRE